MICHWIYLAGGATATSGFSSINKWGDSKYYTHDQWGKNGAGIIGSTIKSNGVTLSSSYGFTLDPPALREDNLFRAGAYAMSWYQPTMASVYAWNTLRRYGGGTTGGDKVKAYCMEMRLIATTTVLATSDYGIVAADSTGKDGVVTLSGAASLVASGLALGAVMLAL